MGESSRAGIQEKNKQGRAVSSRTSFPAEKRIANQSQLLGNFIPLLFQLASEVRQRLQTEWKGRGDYENRGDTFTEKGIRRQSQYKGEGQQGANRKKAKAVAHEK